ncbi:hypothetical protein SAMN04488028_104304 [Reichenbachiella agariperforans]|uniref:Uncharacterized protein n=1 Tax=Reichenbachiella agariperforans TaxID=156994 RepID=A0A1M6RVN0_REIAG|nr:hypothetical protein SAMN04488028_104304 [Reichenbachiella agariperforans]
MDMTAGQFRGKEGGRAFGSLIGSPMRPTSQVHFSTLRRSSEGQKMHFSVFRKFAEGPKIDFSASASLRRVQKRIFLLSASPRKVQKRIFLLFPACGRFANSRCVFCFFDIKKPSRERRLSAVRRPDSE